MLEYGKMQFTDNRVLIAKHEKCWKRTGFELITEMLVKFVAILKIKFRHRYAIVESMYHIGNKYFVKP